MRVLEGLIFFVAAMICLGLVARPETLARSQGSFAPLAFDIVSIKPDVSDGTSNTAIFVGCHGQDGVDPPWRAVPTGMCIGSRATAQMLLAYAYDVGSSMNVPLKGSIVGESDWLSRDRFSIQAKSENPPSLDDEKTMLQTMLADRFKLRSHIETKEVDGYVLTAGKDGPKIQPVSEQEAPPVPGRLRTTSSLQQASGHETNQGMSFGGKLRPGEGGQYVVLGRALSYVNVTMGYVARGLSNDFGMPVMDQTGLKGTYNLFTPFYGLQDDMESTSPPLSKILDDVGLKLEKQKVPMRILVIDYIEKPSVN